MHRSRGRPRQDLPRLVDGHVALQVFTAFTHVPSAPRCAGPLPVCDPLPVGNSNASFDAVAALVPFSGAKRRAQSANAKRTPLTRAARAVRAGYPLRALRSLRERALHQARRMRDVAARSGGALVLLTSGEDLDAYVARRAACLRRPGGCPFTAGLLVRRPAPLRSACWII
jgi:hypothetical protein